MNKTETVIVRAGDEFKCRMESCQRREAEMQAEIDRLRNMLGECYVLSGADTDGDPPERHAETAVRAVGDLRRDYDENEDWQGRALAAEKDAARYRWLRDTGSHTAIMFILDQRRESNEWDAEIDEAMEAGE
ncbi:MAG: hypothetical protein JST65_00935 [Acidobacteria bacterium]|nr:hypothetical protein [Acidobacteriota bacterium]